MLVLALAVALAGPARPAGAEEAPDAPSWYGWQTLAVDLGAATLFTVGAREENAPALALGVGLFVLGGPVVHLMHDDGRWWKSLAWRTGLPMAGFGLGALAGWSLGCEPADDLCPALPMIVLGLGGAGIGAGAAMVVDAATLGREPTPTVSPLPGGGMLVGLAGAW